MTIFRKTMRIAGIVLLAVLAVAVVGCMITQPTMRSNSPSHATVEPARLRVHVEALSQTFHPRDWTNVANLDRCAGYISDHFRKAGAQVEEQVYQFHGRHYRNVIGRFGAGRGARHGVGAHYDAFGDSPGADDNASAVAALIELAYPRLSPPVTRHRRGVRGARRVVKLPDEGAAGRRVIRRHAELALDYHRVSMATVAMIEALRTL